MTDGRSSARMTLCVLAGAGALIGGVAGAAIVGKLATDGSAPAAMARNDPPAAPPSRPAAAAALASASATRGPTPWSAADAKAARAAGRRHRDDDHAAREHVPLRKAVRSARTGAARAAPSASVDKTVVTRTRAPAAPVTVAPQASTPTRTPVRSPARLPARAPEPAPDVTRPSPEPAPAHTPPEPDPTGAFDDSG
jgi:hypothetical protein